MQGTEVGIKRTNQDYGSAAAKAGCALKVSTAAERGAGRSTLASLNRSMEPIDRDIIQMMIGKIGGQ